MTARRHLHAVRPLREPQLSVGRFFGLLGLCGFVSVLCLVGACRLLQLAGVLP